MNLLYGAIEMVDYDSPFMLKICSYAIGLSTKVKIGEHKLFCSISIYFLCTVG